MVPIIANGALEDQEKAEEVLARSYGDIISLGKGALANQDCRIEFLKIEN